MSFQFRVRPGELAVLLTGAGKAAITDCVAVGDWTSCRGRFPVFRTNRVFPAHGFTCPFDHERPALWNKSRLLTLRADFQTDPDAIRPMYGHDSVLTGKAISAVLGEERGRLKERIKAYRQQLSAIQPLELQLWPLQTFVCLSFYPMDWSCQLLSSTWFFPDRLTQPLIRLLVDTVLVSLTE